jgi:PAS domain S-box-containing protein
MRDRQSTTTPALIRWGVPIAATIAILVGGFWLAAWLSGIAAQWSEEGYLTVKTNTSVAILLAGLALLLLAPCKVRTPWRWLGAVFAALVLVIGVSTLCEHLFGVSLGIDQLLAKEGSFALATVSPNRPGPPASLSLTLLGIALLCLAFGRRAIVPHLGVVVLLISFIPAVGFLYGIHAFYGEPHLTHIAWPTVIALLSLGAGLILALGESGPLALLLRNDAGGEMLRRLLPTSVLIFLILGFLRVQGQRSSLYDTAEGTGLLLIALIVAFTAMLWRGATRLSYSDTAHREDEEALRDAEERLAFALATSRVGAWDLDLVDHTANRSLDHDRIFGYDNLLPEWTYEMFLEHVLPEDRAEVDAKFQHAIQTRGDWSFECRIRRADGEVRWIWAAGRHWPDATGAIRRMAGIVQDITERKQSEARLRDLASFPLQNPNPIVRIMADGMISFANKSGQELLDCWNLTVGQPANEHLISEIRKENVIRDIEELCRDRTFLLTIAPLEEVGYTNIYGRDITERKNAEESLREARDYLDNLINYANAPIIVWDPDSRITRFNHAFERMTGHAADEVMGKDLRVLFPEATRDDSLRKIERTLTGEYWETVEIPILCKNGEVRVALWNSARIYAGDGKTLVAVIAQGQDITLRKHAEEALRLSEGRLEMAQSAAGIGTWDWDINTEKLEWSGQMFELFGLDPAETNASFDVWESVLHPEDREIAGARIEQALKEHTSLDSEYRIIRPDGQVRWINALGHGVYDAQGRPERMTGVCSDVTDRRQAEEREREIEASRAEFLRRTIRAATNGKLEIVDTNELRTMYGKVVRTWKFGTPKEYSATMDESFRMAESLGLTGDGFNRFMCCAGEMLGNAQKHAGGGKASLYRRDHRILYVVSDTGQGIDAINLPDVALVDGYSTAGSGGLGYKLIINCADKTYLATSPEGTTVAVEMRMPSEADVSSSQTAGAGAPLCNS